MSWIKKKRFDEGKAFIEGFSALCASLGGPLSEEIHALVKAGKLKDVIDFKIDYELDYTLSDFKYARQIQALFSKQSYIDVGYDPELEALNKFIQMEEKCRETNRRIEEDRSPHGDVSSVFYIASRKIARILGTVPNLDALDFSFGPGATTNVKSTDACFRSKLSASLTCSDDMIPFVGEFLSEFPYLVEHHAFMTSYDLEELWNSKTSVLEDTVPVSRTVKVQISDGKLCFVPKTSKTHRPIVVEPLLNGLMQKGIGSYMKNRLLRHGIDLSDQTRNQRLAMIGSLNNKLATIDLSSASDCVSVSLVWDLLPPEWAEFLSTCRTGTVSYKTSTYTLEKFSSMGNGYTFELESLIFYGLAFAVCIHLELDCDQLSVYGDDIIVPVEACELLSKVLDYAGFVVNPEKSFSKGKFRESCGTDWFLGFDIRPFYLREEISEQILYLFHNWCIRNCETLLAEYILKRTRPDLRLYGPDGYGDGHLVGSYRLRTNRKIKRDGWCGGFFDTYSLKPQSFKRLLPGDWLVPQYSVYTRSGERSPTDPNIVRGSRGYAKVSIYTLATSVFRRA